MSTETPLYDELEAKWAEEYYQRAICDQYWTVTHTATLQTWLEDDEGNEVFPETALDEPMQTYQIEIYNVEDAQFSRGGWIEHPKLDHLEVRDGMVRFKDSDYPVGIIPKRKFKLFGRNQGTNGTL